MTFAHRSTALVSGDQPIAALKMQLPVKHPLPGEFTFPASVASCKPNVWMRRLIVLITLKSVKIKLTKQRLVNKGTIRLFRTPLFRQPLLRQPLFRQTLFRHSAWSELRGSFITLAQKSEKRKEFRGSLGARPRKFSSHQNVIFRSHIRCKKWKRVGGVGPQPYPTSPP